MLRSLQDVSFSTPVPPHTLWGDKSILKGYRTLSKPRGARLPDGSIVRYAGIGTIQTKRFSITEVYHIEGLAENLICVSQLEVQYGLGFCIAERKCRIKLFDDKTIICSVSSMFLLDQFRKSKEGRRRTFLPDKFNPCLLAVVLLVCWPPCWPFVFARLLLSFFSVL